MNSMSWKSLHVSSFKRRTFPFYGCILFQCINTNMIIMTMFILWMYYLFDQFLKGFLQGLNLESAHILGPSPLQWAEWVYTGTGKSSNFVCRAGLQNQEWNSGWQVWLIEFSWHLRDLLHMSHRVRSSGCICATGHSPALLPLCTLKGEEAPGRRMGVGIQTRDFSVPSSRSCESMPHLCVNTGSNQSIQELRWTKKCDIFVFTNS